MSWASMRKLSEMIKETADNDALEKGTKATILAGLAGSISLQFDELDKHFTAMVEAARLMEK